MKIRFCVYLDSLKTIRFLFLVIASVGNGQAQSTYGHFEYGTVDTAWIRKLVYEKDTTAEAVILYSYGSCKTDLYRGTKFTVRTTLKILKKSATEDLGFREIPGAYYTKLTDFKGVVYNFENGQVTKNELTLEDVLATSSKKDGNYNIPFQNVQPGSLIDYTFSISLYYSFPFTWNFQHAYPVLYSEYEIFYAGGEYGSQAVVNGSYMLDITSREKGRFRNFKARDLPAFKEEPYMPTSNWYRSSVEFGHRGEKEKYLIYQLKLLEEEGIMRDSAIMDTKNLAQIDLKIDPKGLLTGTIDLKWSGLGAILARPEIKESGEEEVLKSNYEGELWDVKKQTLENTDTSSNELIARYELSIPDKIQVTDSLLYINPYPALKEERNPFKLETRLYPVDMGSRIERTMIAQLTLPEGYEVDELPKSEMLALPNKAGTFISSITHQGNKIYITSKIKINKIIFNVPEYPALREFFVQIIAKKSKPIVLRKVGSD